MTNFPTSLDSFTNLTPGTTEGSSSRVSDSVGGYTHAQMHGAENDVLEALQAKVGIDSSAVTTSIDYKLKSTSSIDPGHKHTEASLNTSNVTTGDVTSTKHGYAPKSPADATKFLNGAATPAYAAVKDSDLSTSDITTNDFSTSKHGFVPKGTNVGSYLKDDGTWSPVSAGASALTIMPQPNFKPAGNNAAVSIATNTTAFVGQICIPYGITVNKLSFRVDGVAVAGTVKIGLFTEDGQTLKISITTASISGASVVTTAVSAVAITAGIYYIVILPVGTASLSPVFFDPNDGFSQDTVLNSVSSEPIINGSVTVTASTMPSTITPTTLTASSSQRTLMCRLDN